MLADVTLSLEVVDPVALHRAAVESFEDDLQEDADEWLGTESEPKIENCLRQLIDRPPSGHDTTLSAGYQTLDSSASAKRSDVRTSTVLHVSTGHITPEERHVIDRVLALDPPETARPRARIDASHRGLYVSPKDYGWIFRVPTTAERLAEALDASTPEMAAIVRLAVEIGATRIEFDSDEDPIEGLEWHDDRTLLLRDPATGPGNPAEAVALYHNERLGWVVRSEATSYHLGQAEMVDLTLLPDGVHFVDSADPNDKPYALP